MKNLLNAILALFCFQKYTDMPRPLEIGYGILAYFNVAIIIYAWC